MPHNIDVVKENRRYFKWSEIIGDEKYANMVLGIFLFLF